MKIQLLSRASARLNLPAENLFCRDGRVISRSDPDRSIHWEEQIPRGEGSDGIIRALGTSTMPVASEDFGGGLPHKTYSYLTQIALVGVDTGTGEVEVIRMISLPEIGKAINLAGVEGQVEGSVVMGQGYALMEEVVAKRGVF